MLKQDKLVSSFAFIFNWRRYRSTTKFNVVNSLQDHIRDAGFIITYAALKRVRPPGTWPIHQITCSGTNVIV